MNGSTAITIDGREYQVKYHIQKGSKEGGLSPDIPDHIDDLEVWKTEKIRVTNQKIINKAYEQLTKEL